MLEELLRCPDCLGRLGDGDDGARRCTDCEATYGQDDGLAQLVGEKSELNLSEVATQDYVTDFYEDVRYRLPWARAYHEHTLEQMIGLADLSGHVLDNGCGNGVFLEHLVRRGWRGKRCVGTDISMGMLRHAQRRLADLDHPPGFALAQADACRLPFADDSFDVVFARGLLHHLPSPADGAREMARVLRPGGTVLVLDPNRTLLSEIPRRLARKTTHFDEEHKHFTAAELERILAPCFDVAEVHYVGYVAYPLLGFPDITNFGKVLPLGTLAPYLVKLDDWVARVLGVRALAWGMVMRGVARPS